MVYDLLLFAVVGAAVGSFLTLVVERYDMVESVWLGRSHCDHCKRQLAWYELVPVMSFFYLRGQCKTCTKAIPRIYPAFEVLTALSFMALRWEAGTSGLSWVLFFNLLIASSLLALAFYDWLHQSFPITFLGLSLGLVLISLIVRGITGESSAGTLTLLPVWDGARSFVGSHALGALFGVGLLGLFALPSRGHWMGYGDVLLAGVLGLWLGYPLIVTVLLVAFYIGAIIGGGLLLFKKLGKDHRIAFGPFLIGAAVIVAAYGDILSQAVIRLWGLE